MSKNYTLTIHIKKDDGELADALHEIAKMVREGYNQGIDRPRGCNWDIE